jgi:hypothetical protein
VGACEWSKNTGLWVNKRSLSVWDTAVGRGGGCGERDQRGGACLQVCAMGGVREGEGCSRWRKGQYNGAGLSLTLSGDPVHLGSW